MSPKVSVAILGATGAVGAEFLTLFEQRSFPLGNLKLLASERSVGKTISYHGVEIAIELARNEVFDGVDFAFFSAGASRSRAFVEAAINAGAVVIDNSSAFRMDPDVPLVVPEVNGDVIRDSDRLIANPNCTAAILVMALKPLLDLAPIERVVVSTYQSASGGGAAMMHELERQTGNVLAGRDPEPQELPHQYAFNVFSHNTPINEHGYNDEEWKVIQETRKILGIPDLRVGVTCVRVPVLRAHSEAVTVEFADSAPSEAAVREALEAFPGVRVIDDRAANRFPMPVDASGGDDVLVGRIRTDVSHPRAISLFVVGDQLRKGAALNAVQIAEHMLAHRGVAAGRP